METESSALRWRSKRARTELWTIDTGNSCTKPITTTTTTGFSESKAKKFNHKSERKTASKDSGNSLFYFGIYLYISICSFFFLNGFRFSHSFQIELTVFFFFNFRMHGSYLLVLIKYNLKLVLGIEWLTLRRSSHVNTPMSLNHNKFESKKGWIKENKRNHHFLSCIEV